ncbi:hypothetical protein [Dankookia sp. P2]|uniref:hypothetical protein n=1 Tax=Dankookia sp. P2 TaxID=3423955 RepID=UPI003D67CEDA
MKRLDQDGEMTPEVRHRTSRYPNKRAEWNRPTRRRERYLQRFMSPEQAQRFLSSHAMIYGHFRARRHLMAATRYRRPPGVAAEDVRSDGSLRARTTAQPASARTLTQQLGKARSAILGYAVDHIGALGTLLVRPICSSTLT